jgi:uncharacterized protein (DUF488 family)
MTIKLVTIGVYGFSEAGFFQSLLAAQVDTFVDVRRRRGLRGSTYAFANSQRLQTRLAELGIRYLYRRDLAPPPTVRQRQLLVDKAGKIAKRQREQLSPTFVSAYQAKVLKHFAAESLVDGLPAGTQVVALFCVERLPGACHRSLLAEELQRQQGWEVKHIMP